MKTTFLATAPGNRPPKSGNRLPEIRAYANPRTGSISHRLTYWRGEKRIRVNYRTVEEAEHAKERVMQVQEPASKIEVDRLIRTHLTIAQLHLAERVFADYPEVDFLDAVRSWRPPATITLPESLEAFLAEQRGRGVRARTLDNHSSTLRKLVRETKANPDIFAKWVQNPEWSLRTRRDRLDLARHWIRWAVARGHLATDPLVHVPRPMVRNSLPAVLTVDQVEALMVAAATDEIEQGRDKGQVNGPTAIGLMLPWFAICAYSGIRPEEAMRLTWDRINLDSGVAELDPSCTKVGLVRAVRLTAKLVALLVGAKEEGLEPGFVSRRAYRRIRDAAGVPWAIDILRHTYVSHRYAIDGDLNEIARDCGNSVAVIQKHYLRRTISREDGERYFSL
jgi:integrase